jgi:hypothetical protein
LREIGGNNPAQRIPAATGRERKDDPGQWAGLTERMSRFRGERQTGGSGGSGDKIPAIHSLFDPLSGLLYDPLADLT